MNIQYAEVCPDRDGRYLAFVRHPDRWASWEFAAFTRATGRGVWLMDGSCINDRLVAWADEPPDPRHPGAMVPAEATTDAGA